LEGRFKNATSEVIRAGLRLLEEEESKVTALKNVISEGIDSGIAKNPEFGKNYEGIVPTLFGLRAKKHIIFYRLISKNEIEITRILHENMDLKKGTTGFKVETLC